MTLSAAILCAVLLLQTAQNPVSLTLSGRRGEVVFPSGSVIQIPKGTVYTAAEFRLPGWTGKSPRLHVDRVFRRTDDSRRGDDAILSASTLEQLGLLQKEEHRLELLLDNVFTPAAEWTVRRWDRAYLDAHRSAKDEAMPDVEFDAPHDGLVYFATRPTEILIQGAVLGPDDYRVYVLGREVQRDLGLRAWGFKATVPITSETTDIEVRVETPRGSIRWLRIPIPR